MCPSKAYMPSPTNCSRFYFCGQDGWSSGSCQLGQLFDQTKLVCVPSSHAHCHPPCTDMAMEMMYNLPDLDDLPDDNLWNGIGENPCT